MEEKNVIIGDECERVLDDTSIGELLLLLMKTHGDNVLQVDIATDEELPANLLLSRAIELAKWMKTQGIGVGDNISINSENRLEFCIVPVAAMLLGATFAPLNPDYTPGELKHVIGLSKPRMVFCSEATIDKMVGIWPNHDYIESLIAFGKAPPKHETVVAYDPIIAGATGENLDENFQATPVDPKETVATILCSSGTTGLPKGVMCLQESMLYYLDAMRNLMSDMLANEDPSDAMFGMTPFFHSMGFMLMFGNLFRGKKMVVVSKFKLKQFLEAVQKYKIRRVVVPPPVMVILLKHPLTKKYDMSGIREIRTGAAPLGKDLERELKTRWGVSHVSQGYGMTETTLGVLISPFDHTKAGSSGKLIPGMKAKVIDDEGAALGPYKEGELCFKGPMIMKGYVNDPIATANTIDKDGYLHTGDVGYYDEEGYFFVVDRIKELIKYKAFQVAPAELEQLLMTHPAIQDAAVIGLPEEAAGELPLAFIVKKPGHNITEAEAEKFVADNVSPQKRLRGGVVFLDEIPRNPTGKILRRVLRDRATKLKSKL